MQQLLNVYVDRRASSGDTTNMADINSFAYILKPSFLAIGLSAYTVLTLDKHIYISSICDKNYGRTFVSKVQVSQEVT